jgi:hypothetical protein
MFMRAQKVQMPSQERDLGTLPWIDWHLFPCHKHVLVPTNHCGHFSNKSVPSGSAAFVTKTVGPVR